MYRYFLLLCQLVCLMAGGCAVAAAQQPAVEPPEQAARRVSLKLDIANQSYTSKDYGTAIVQYQALLQDPAAAGFIAHCHYYLGRSFLLTEKYADAISHYQQIPPGKFIALAARYETGKAYLAQDNQAQASAAYRWLLEEAAQSTNLKVTPEEQLVPGTSRVLTFKEIQQNYRAFAQELCNILAERFTVEAAAQYGVKQEPYPAAARRAPASANTPEIPAMGKDGVSRPTITYKEKAKYTEIARVNRVQGTVVLNVVFSAEGEMKQIRVVRGLEDGLLRQAIIAAANIRFQPATKDGTPVSVRGNLEYSFNLY